MLGIAIFTIVVSKRIMKKPRQSVINASQGLCRSVTFGGPPGVAVADAVTSLPSLSTPRCSRYRPMPTIEATASAIGMLLASNAENPVKVTLRCVWARG
jgi:hypothetical protein